MGERWKAEDSKCNGCGRFLPLDMELDDEWVFYCGDCGRETFAKKQRQRSNDGRGT